MAFQNDRITGIPAPLPKDYDRQRNFTDYQTANPGKPMQGADLDVEFNVIQQALDETQARARLIQRDDGAVLNEAIGLDQLKTEAKIGVNAPADWAAFTQYQVNDSVIVNGGTWYLALVSHVSSDVFQTDLDAGNWRELINLVPYTTEAKNWATLAPDTPVPEGNGVDDFSAEHHASKAKTSETNAKTSETNAANSKTAALASENKAKKWADEVENTEVETGKYSALHHAAKSAASASAAKTSETNAASSASAASTSETNAASSASAASTSETNAAAKLAEFKNIYYGPLADDPAARPDGSASVQGDIYYNTTAKTLKEYDGASWLNFTDANAYTKAESEGRYAPITRSRKNVLINGGLIIWQEATSKVYAAAGAGYFAEMWNSRNSADGQFTVAKASFPGGNKPCAKLTVDAAGTDFTLGKYWFGFRHQAEDHGVIHLNGKNVTLSFDFQANFSGTLPISIRNADSTRSYVTTFSFTANSPIRVTKTIPLEAATVPSPASGTGLDVSIGFQNAGDYVTSTPDQWVAGNFLSTTSDTLYAKTLGNELFIDDVQLEEGDEATDFEFRSYGGELALCQRYFQTGGYIWRSGYLGSTKTGNQESHSLATPMRAMPSVTLLATNGLSNMTALELAADDVSTIRSLPTVTTSGAHTRYGFSYAADSRL